MGYQFNCSKNDKYELIVSVDHEYDLNLYEFIYGDFTEMIRGKNTDEAKEKAESLYMKLKDAKTRK